MTVTENRQLELTAPVGSFESLNAAIKAGADSIYFGVEQLNMRARSAKKFALSDLTKIVEIASAQGVKSYLALNTIIYNDELSLMQKICDTAHQAGVSALIASDISAISYTHKIGMEVHVSTQANICNFEAVKYYAKYADVLVLARELDLEQIIQIIQQIDEEKICGPLGNKVRIELFVHGALCVSISGKCYMSLATTNSSANRGECLQTCRRTYRVIDEATNEELVIDNQFIMSPKDVCMIRNMDDLIRAGVNVFKIEGRGRSPDYVYHTTKAYREAINSVLDGSYSQEKIKQWISQLENVYNRGFWYGGYYLGKKLGEWSGAYGSVAKKQKTYIGHVINYYQKAQVGQFKIETGELKIGDRLAITGPTTGYEEYKIKSFSVDETPVQTATRGHEVTIPLDFRVRKNDKVYLIQDRKNWQS